MPKRTNPLTRLEKEGLLDELPSLFDNAHGQTSGLRVRQYERKLRPGQSDNDQDPDSTETPTAWIDRKNLEAFGRVHQNILPGSSFAEQAVADAFPQPVSTFTTPTAIFWQNFEAAIHLLPHNYARRERAFLVALSILGCVDQARSKCKVKSKSVAYAYLDRFAKWRKKNEC